MNGPVVASIWAQDRARVLGSGTGMLWRVPADFAHFKESTMGCPLVMGRASWEALGGALPGRLNIVVTRTPGYEAPGGVVVGSIDEAMGRARGFVDARSGVGSEAPGRIWIAGGATVYEQTMGIVDELVITDLDLSVAGDGPVVRAPVIDEAVWRVDAGRSDEEWRPVSGDARWRVTTWVRR
ncbi:dihydrofolate reductase [Actinomyces sp. B33]|uniref:dihydrofolate reductase n=1 Tax=Actinomyces sp. B33 TaxID=2942131 RepID=UPI00233FD38A|nr:dihydrofolate reductase [Actinomyces sp. B33]MDC4233875.1 dihydrofolate reductase [Actinomyces sp. B33]